MSENTQERIALVELEVPGVPTGETALLSQRSAGQHRGWAVSVVGHSEYRYLDACGGTLDFSGPNGKPYGNPTYLRCKACDYRYSWTNERVRSHIPEWRKIVFSAALEALVDKWRREPGKTRHIGDFQPKMGDLIGDNIVPFLPPDRITIRGLQGTSAESSLDHVPFWPEHGMAVLRVIGVDDLSLEGIMLFLNAAALLCEMEKSFQDAIQRAAQRASSASETFHPKTRRQLQDSGR